jgi:hypothetical protein
MTTQVIHARLLRDGRRATLVKCTRCGLRTWVIGSDAPHGCNHDNDDDKGNQP